jgi:hypothetical protein
VCLDNLSPAQNGRAFAIYAEIRKRLQRRMKAAARVKGGFAFFGFWEKPDLCGRQQLPNGLAHLFCVR